jgi:hypothetical protein
LSIEGSERGPFGNSIPSDREITSAVCKHVKHRSESTHAYVRLAYPLAGAIRLTEQHNHIEKPDWVTFIS